MPLFVDFYNDYVAASEHLPGNFELKRREATDVLAQLCTV